MALGRKKDSQIFKQTSKVIGRSVIVGILTGVVLAKVGHVSPAENVMLASFTGVVHLILDRLCTVLFNDSGASHGT